MLSWKQHFPYILKGFKWDKNNVNLTLIILKYNVSKCPYSDKWEGHSKISYYIKKPHKSYYLSNALKTSYSFDSFSKSYKNRNVELMILLSKNNVT